MTSGNSEQQSSLDKARSYLERAEAWLGQLPGFPESPEHVVAAASIGTGFAVLAQVEALGPVPTVITGFGSGVDAAAVRRGIQAAEEARPHDGELVHTPGPDPTGVCPACRALGGDDRDHDRG